jgi:hypothetical protein
MITTSDAIKNYIKKLLRRDSTLTDSQIVRDLIDNKSSYDDFLGYLTHMEPEDLIGQSDMGTYVTRELNNFLSLINDRNSRVNATIFENQYSNNTVLSLPGSMDDNCFSKYINHILRQRDFDFESVSQLKNECESIVNLLPTIDDSNDRIGLVIGKVQSGKTSTFNGLISAAIDLRYNVIIIVSGLKENLRVQTQKRFESDVVEILQPTEHNDYRKVNFISLTSVDRASQNLSPGNRIFGNLVGSNPPNIIYGVYLKNGNNLRRLIKKIESTNQNYLRNIKALIIDDESDEATPNTSGDVNNPITINRLLRQLRQSLNKATYLQFTATPFANILNEMGDDTLYPRNFIHVLETPKKYFGPMQLFGDPDLNEEEQGYFDPLDAIREVPKAELNEIMEINDACNFHNTNLLNFKESVLWFLISTAIREKRGNVDFSSMLIHTSGRISQHKVLYEYTIKTLEWLSNNHTAYMDGCRDLWFVEKDRITIDDLRRVFPDYGMEFLPDLDFDEFSDWLIPVLNNTVIRIDNGEADPEIRLNYGNESPKYQIAIGGNTLSRGLTLYGLTSCYFVRTVSNFDTLMQMGRWFGYKIGFETLPRIWTTLKLKDGFRNLVSMEIHLKNDIKTKYSNGLATPRQIAPKILRRPDFQITRRNAMRLAHISEVDFSGTALQTIMFNNDSSQLQSNEDLTREFLETAINENLFVKDDVNNRVVIENLNLDLINEFLSNYHSIEDGRGFNLEKINQFINRNRALFTKWNVAVIGGSKDNSHFEFGKFSVSRMNRSRIKSTENDEGGRVDKLNLKGIMSKDDSFVDIQDIPFEFKETREKSILYRSKKNLPSLLIIYPIDKNSKPVKRSNNRSSITRYDLNADEHLIGIALILNLGLNKTVEEYVRLENADFNEYSNDDNNDDDIMTENQSELNDDEIYGYEN